MHFLQCLQRISKSQDDGKKKFYSSQNVVDEIGQAAGKAIILIVEEDTEIFVKYSD